MKRRDAFRMPHYFLAVVQNRNLSFNRTNLSVPKPVFHTAIAARAEVMRYYDPVRIQGYCRTCEKHGRFWSCPSFSVSPLTQFPEWDHAIIVCEKVWTAPEASSEQMIAQFFEARKVFRKWLLEVEQQQSGLTALVAGFCTGCTECTREEGKPCRTPSALRYSLEAVGFDVTGLVEGLAGQKLQWAKGKAPEYLMTVGAILCPDHAAAEQACRALATYREMMP